MSKRSIALAAVVALAGASFGVMALASANPASGAAKAGAATMTYRAVTTESNFVDNGASGPSQGDEFLFRDKLMQSGKKKGTDGGVCTLTRSGAKGAAECVVTLHLTNGQITIQGLVPGGNQPRFTLPITGGSRDYRTARGQVHVNQKSQKVAVLRVVLIP